MLSDKEKHQVPARVLAPLLKFAKFANGPHDQRARWLNEPKSRAESLSLMVDLPSKGLYEGD